jgi:hypothetical protein
MLDFTTKPGKDSNGHRIRFNLATGDIIIVPARRAKAQSPGDDPGQSRILINRLPKLDADSWTALAKLIGRFSINSALNIVTELLKKED